MSAPSSQLPDETFRSRVDVWLVVLIVASTIVPMVVLMVNPSSRGGLGWASGMAITVGSAVVVLLLFGWTARTTEYILHDDALFIRCAGLNWHVAYRDIRSVQKSNNPMSSAALSLRRIEICYGRYGRVLISPPDRDAFIDALKQRVPNLEVKG